MENNILETMIKNTGKTIHRNEGDYLNEDGLLMCGICHTPKQCRFIAKWDGKEKTPFIQCDCERECREAEE